MKKASRTIFAVLTMAATALAADNTLGTWKLNAAKSKPAASISPLTNLTLTREATDGGVKVSAKGERADGTKVDTTTVVKYDGKAVDVKGAGSAWDTVSAKQPTANTLTEERTKKGGKYHTTARTVISDDGKMLTTTSEGTGADGKPFSAVLVFDKQ
jgi:hypothetical protein